MPDADARRRIVEVARRKNLDAPPTALDCSKFVCRVAGEALGYDVGTLAESAGWAAGVARDDRCSVSWQ
jgi:hypothetical protein